MGLRTFLTPDDRVEKVAAFVAEHFNENVNPLAYKAFRGRQRRHEDLDVLLDDFKKKMSVAQSLYLEVGEGAAMNGLSARFLGRFLDPDARTAFYEAYKDTERLRREGWVCCRSCVQDAALDRTKRDAERTRSSHQSVTFDVKTLAAVAAEKEAAMKAAADSGLSSSQWT